MTSPTSSARDLPPGRWEGDEPTLAGSRSSQSPTECQSCEKIWQTCQGSVWPPKEDTEKPCHGYPALATFMFNNPGFESFQAFRDLHVKSLLYYQGQLYNLREDLHALEWEDHDRETFKNHEKVSKNVKYLFKREPIRATGGAHAARGTENLSTSESERARVVTDDKDKQVRKVEEMRKVLKDYSEALLLYTNINDLPAPEKFEVKNLLKWLRRERAIDGGGANSWGLVNQVQSDQPSISSQFFRLIRTMFWSREEDEIDLDLVVPRKNKSADGLTKWIESEGVPFWERIREALKNRRAFFTCTLPRPSGSSSPNHGSIASNTTLSRFFSGLIRKMSNDSQDSEDSEKTGKVKIVTYRFRTLLAITTFITTVFASLLPIVAIVVLSKLHTQPMILGFIALFTGLFTMGLMMLTPPGTKRTEIFTASAAFAAVMVVFVQNQTGGNGS